MWFKGGCEGKGGGFGSVTLTFVSRIGPHRPLADFPGATYSAGKSQQVKQGPISWELAPKTGNTSANGEEKSKERKGGGSGVRTTHTVTVPCDTHMHTRYDELVRGFQTSSSVQAVNFSHLQTRTPAALSDRRFKILGLGETSRRLCNLLSSSFQTIPVQMQRIQESQVSFIPRVRFPDWEKFIQPLTSRDFQPFPGIAEATCLRCRDLIWRESE